MIKDYIKGFILQNFGHKPTIQQEEAINSLCDFIASPESDQVFLLRGFAGTGKTSLVSALVKSMKQLEKECVLMAPTGRAAKVLSNYADHPAYTIHKRIYRQKSMDIDSTFSLNFNKKQGTLFICDEASMISNDELLSGTMYGTGRLLDDMVRFIYEAKGCKLILLGDTAQLPPVGDAESPALQEYTYSSYNLATVCHTLTAVVRQADSSGILWNATLLRKLMEEDAVYDLPHLRFEGFPDFINLSGNELIETLENCYHRDGLDETIVITRSNKRAIAYNNGIRNQILWRESQLEGGDILMIAKNNYFWTEEMKKEAPFDFLANGDTAVLKRFRRERTLYGFTYADCELSFPDYNDFTMELTVLLDTLQSEAPALTAEQQDTLFNNIMEDYSYDPSLTTKPQRLKALRKDPYYNALQVKYAYAITCHKAQGGQWANVFIDQGYLTEDMLGPDYYRWLYTAITRGTKRVYMVNWKNELPEKH